MCGAAPTGFNFTYIVCEQWEISHALGHNKINYQEKLMNKDQMKGRIEEAKGKVKEATGVLLDDEGMEVKGNIQKNVGKVQKAFGDLKEDIKDKLDD